MKSNSQMMSLNYLSFINRPLLKFWMRRPKYPFILLILRMTFYSRFIILPPVHIWTSLSLLETKIFLTSLMTDSFPWFRNYKRRTLISQTLKIRVNNRWPITTLTDSSTAGCQPISMGGRHCMTFLMPVMTSCGNSSQTSTTRLKFQMISQHGFIRPLS